MAVGMGTMMHMADYLQTYKNARTAIYCYYKMDDPSAGDLIRHLPDQEKKKAFATWLTKARSMRKLPLECVIG